MGNPSKLGTPFLGAPPAPCTCLYPAASLFVVHCTPANYTPGVKALFKALTIGVFASYNLMIMVSMLR